jgi:hypothetical protein
MRIPCTWALPWLLSLVVFQAPAQRVAWIPTWTASPEPAAGSDEKWLPLENRTVRERIRVSAGGPQIRLVLSNEYGAAPLQVGAVTVGSPQSARSVRPESILAVTFEGSRSVVVPPGAPILSDPIAFPVSDGEEISISLFFPKP